MNRRWKLAMAVTVSLVGTGMMADTIVVAGDGWPRFQGAAGSGEAASIQLPASFPEASLAWRVDLPGRGLSGPVVSGDKVFLSASSGVQQDRLHVICFVVASGARLWERQVWATGRTMCHEKTSVAAPTPCTDGKHVVVLFSSNDLVCFDMNGGLLWLRGITADYPNVSNSLGMASSPAIVDDVVVVQVENDSESYTLGVDVSTGVNQWRLSRPKAANWTSPVVLDAGLIGLQSSAGMEAVRVRDGSVAWRYDDGASTIPSSCRQGQVVYVPSHGVTALDFADVTDGRPKQLWQTSRLSPGTSSPVVSGGLVFAISKGDVLTACRTTDGERVWQVRLQGPFSATPVIVGDRIVCVSERGLVQVVTFTDTTADVSGTLDLEDQILGSPAVAAGGVFLRSNTSLWKLRAAE
jgi:outer membrane protein assembly factor BamB